jgi:hypothetical protein
MVRIPKQTIFDFVDAVRIPVQRLGMIVLASSLLNSIAGTN